MANHKSAVKRHRQSLLRRTRNRAVKTRIRSMLKLARAAIEGKADNAETLLRETSSLLDSAASKHIVPSERAARLKSRLGIGLARQQKSA